MAMEQTSEPSFKKQLSLRCKTMQTVGDSKVTEYISNMVFTKSAYYRYFGKKHIRRAFDLAKEKIRKFDAFKMFMHGAGASGKTSLAIRMTQSTFNYEYVH